MGFLYLAIKLPKAITLGFMSNVLAQLKFMMLAALTRLGLYKSPPGDEDYDTGTSSRRDNFVLILDGSSPSLVPIPVHVVTSAIKKKLRVVPNPAGREICCTVCLDVIDGTHEIRELVNCDHVFHRDCLDTWVDEGQITCPLCRSMLLPPRRFFAAGDSIPQSPHLIAG